MNIFSSSRTLYSLTHKLNKENKMLSIKLNLLKCLILFTVLVKYCGAEIRKEDTQIFYRNSSNADGLQSISTTTTRPPFFQNVRLPCSCYQRQCGCCTGIILDAFRQKACMNFTYEPDDFSIGATMTMNGKVLYKNNFSGKNPPPFCARVPRLPFIRLCVTFSNIYFASRNVHFCIDMEANWQDFTLLDWSFDCLRMGVSGFAVVPPEAGGALPPTPVDEEEQTDEDYDDSARNVPLIVDVKYGNDSRNNFSSQENVKSPSGKFETKTISTGTKGMSTITVTNKKSSERNRIYVPYRAEITLDGDIKFSVKKI